ncbi:MAG TPA: gamma carbonic anhydrase family protein [Bacteroidota bacterium]|nr:gamma carbonic anhydrase family protein [Bacteroidota bacterium]
MILSLGEKKPRVHPSVFLAEGAMVIGNVEIGAESSVWFNTVLRADINAIRVGERTNIQDLCVFHVTNRNEVQIGSNVTIGHGAIVHGATVEDSCLIGMGATLLDGVRVGAQSLVAAGSLVREGFVVPEGMLVAGVPATVKRALTRGERESIGRSADNYVKYVQLYRQ